MGAIPSLMISTQAAPSLHPARTQAIVGSDINGRVRRTSEGLHLRHSRAEHRDLPGGLGGGPRLGVGIPQGVGGGAGGFPRVLGIVRLGLPLSVPSLGLLVRIGIVTGVCRLLGVVLGVVVGRLGVPAGIMALQVHLNMSEITGLGLGTCVGFVVWPEMVQLQRSLLRTRGRA